MNNSANTPPTAAVVERTSLWDSGTSNVCLCSTTGAATNSEAAQTTCAAPSLQLPGSHPKCLSRELKAVRRCRWEKRLTQEMTWKIVWCLPPLSGYKIRCRTFAAFGQCANKPSPCVTGRLGMNMHIAAKLKAMRLLLGSCIPSML